MDYVPPTDAHVSDVAAEIELDESLASLRWRPIAVVALVAWAAALNVGQAYALKALDINGLPGELPHFIRAVVVLAFYSAILAPVVISSRRQGLRFADAVGLRVVPNLMLTVGAALLAVIVARMGAVVWAILIQLLRVQLPGGNVDITKLFGDSPTGIIVTVVVAVIVGPFVEEVVFRGVAFAQLERVQGFLPGLFGSSILFGLLHVNPLELVPLVAAGALFAWTFRWTRTLWTAVVAHSLFNLIAVTAMYALKAVAR